MKPTALYILFLKWATWRFPTSAPSLSSIQFSLQTELKDPKDLFYKPSIYFGVSLMGYCVFLQPHTPHSLSPGQFSCWCKMCCNLRGQEHCWVLFSLSHPYALVPMQLKSISFLCRVFWDLLIKTPMRKQGVMLFKILSCVEKSCY